MQNGPFLNPQGSNPYPGEPQDVETPCAETHRQIKRDLRLLEGRITFTYCLKCRQRIDYKGKPKYNPEQSYRLLSLCERCGTSYAAELKEFDAYPDGFWTCPKCGGERVLSNEVAVNG
jgi:hypothetical protein